MYETGSGYTSASGESSTGTDPGTDTYEQLQRRADPVRSHRRVPAAFATTIEACLDPDPTRRPAVGELSARLDAFVRAR